jgi:Peptidase A4 family
MRRWLGASVVAATALLSSAAWGTSPTTVQMMVHKPAHHLVPPGRGVAYTTNWSGYAAKNTTFTDAKGSWVQPAVSCTSNKRQYSSFWVGIDGYASNTVEQIGTDSDCVGRGASYYAWYEMYPAGSVQISNFPVSPGDTISAEVSVSGTSFTLTLTSSRSGTFTTTQSLSTAAKSSAEWVAEAPSSCFVNCSVLPLANFGTVQFSGSYATSSGASSPISSFSNDNIVMETNRGTVKAAPSGLSPDGTAFSDTWHHS